MTWDCFDHSVKMEYQKIVNLFDTASDNVLPRFVTKKMDWRLWSIRRKLQC